MPNIVGLLLALVKTSDDRVGTKKGEAENRVSKHGMVPIKSYMLLLKVPLGAVSVYGSNNLIRSLYHKLLWCHTNYVAT